MSVWLRQRPDQIPCEMFHCGIQQNKLKHFTFCMAVSPLDSEMFLFTLDTYHAFSAFKQARIITLIHAPWVLRPFSFVRLQCNPCFYVSLLPQPTSSAISTVCNTQANYNSVSLFRPPSNLLIHTILPHNLLLLCKTKFVHTKIFSQNFHTQRIRRDKTGDSRHAASQSASAESFKGGRITRHT